MDKVLDVKDEDGISNPQDLYKAKCGSTHLLQTRWKQGLILQNVL